jgi:beta-phosphoglucomutase-like phosphatase (HAD superfamily)
VLYKPSYRGNRRATPGSVETLVRLREHGYRLAIVSNGQIEDQAAKAKAIGIRHLVDRIFTSEEGGCCKPNRRIFQFAIEALGASPHMVHMVGDSADSDIKGALDAGLSAILYSPIAQESQRLLFGEEVPVVRHMGQLLEHLGNHQPLIRALFYLPAKPAGYRGDWHRSSGGAAPLSAHIKRDCTIPCRNYGPSPWECFREALRIRDVSS